ncbi:MAG: DNA-binding protein WhiA [Clostridia bacterium]|nr:DNA-binding protein WhiA [Clostridia bacterium]
MSFSSEVKKELCSIETSNVFQMRAQCYGMILQGVCGPGEISLTTEKKGTAMCLAQLMAELTGVFCDVSNHNRKNQPSSQYYISVPDEDQRKTVLEYFGIQPGHDRLDEKIIAGEYASFVRGLFLTGGTVSNPEKDYHLEIIVQNPGLQAGIISLLDSVSLRPKIIMRASQCVLYYKDSGHIEDMLTFMGAVNASLQVMEVKVVKDVRNRMNRITNCETANIDKTVAASVNQSNAIRKIDSRIGIDSLPEDLREIARLRLENPEMSLSALARELSRPISRSGVNHRLKRICSIADELI